MELLFRDSQRLSNQTQIIYHKLLKFCDARYPILYQLEVATSSLPELPNFYSVTPLLLKSLCSNYGVDYDAKFRFLFEKEQNAIQKIYESEVISSVINILSEHLELNVDSFHDIGKIMNDGTMNKIDFGSKIVKIPTKNSNRDKSSNTANTDIGNNASYKEKSGEKQESIYPCFNPAPLINIPTKLMSYDETLDVLAQPINIESSSDSNTSPSQPENMSEAISMPSIDPNRSASLPPIELPNHMDISNVNLPFSDTIIPNLIILQTSQSSTIESIFPNANINFFPFQPSDMTMAPLPPSKEKEAESHQNEKNESERDDYNDSCNDEDQESLEQSFFLEELNTEFKRFNLKLEKIFQCMITLKIKELLIEGPISSALPLDKAAYCRTKVTNNATSGRYTRKEIKAIASTIKADEKAVRDYILEYNKYLNILTYINNRKNKKQF